RCDSRLHAMPAMRIISNTTMRRSVSITRRTKRVHFMRRLRSTSRRSFVKRQEERAASLGLASLRPWDLAVDPKNRPPLRPFSDAEELARKSQIVFQKIDLELGAQFQMLIDNGLLDIGARPGKAYMGYQTHLTELRMPFIFMVAAGTDDNVRTMMHEAGHAFHAMLSRNQRLWEYQFAADEFCEFAAMGM